MNDVPTEYHMPTGAAGDIEKVSVISKASKLNLNVAADRIKKLNKHLREAATSINKGDWRKAGQLALKALDVDEESGLANHLAAVAMDRLGNTELALKLYMRALEFEPDNTEIYETLGLLAWRIEKFDKATTFFRLQLQLDPASINATNNLGCVLRDMGKFDEAVEVLRTGIYTNPQSALLWNALGSVMMEQARTNEALQFQSEATRLGPKNARNWHNMGNTYLVHGDPQAALEHFSKAKELGNLPLDEAAASEYARSQALVSLGRLEEGWVAHKAMHTPHYIRGTRYLISQIDEWKDGDDLMGKDLLLMGEQGLGDEVLFMSQYKDIREKLVGPDAKIGISCEQRLVSLFQRSFPDAKVMPHATGKHQEGSLRAPRPQDDDLDYDCWMRMSTPLRLIRNDISAFQQPPEGFLKPDPERVEHWRRVVGELGPGVKAGLLWKSRVMTANRKKFFAEFEMWRPALQAPGVKWINLQYGDTEEEVAYAKDKFGVEMVTLPGIDLMNDLDDLCALGQAIDMVVGPSNATSNLMAGAGGCFWMMTTKRHWTLLGQDGFYPWYPNVRLFEAPASNSWDVVIGDIAKALEEFSAQSNAA